MSKARSLGYALIWYSDAKPASFQSDKAMQFL
jgi:hypothetical protein